MCLLVLVCGYICCLFVRLVASLESEIMFVDSENVWFYVFVHSSICFSFLHDTIKNGNRTFVELNSLVQEVKTPFSFWIEILAIISTVTIPGRFTTRYEIGTQWYAQ